MTIKSIAQAFSNGEFQSVFPYLDNTVVWKVVGENEFLGKEAVIAQCLQVEAYFKTVTTQFETINCLVDGNKVAINGTAAFVINQKPKAFVWACDVYEFNKANQLQRITSYCIQKNP